MEAKQIKKEGADAAEEAVRQAKEDMLVHRRIYKK